MCTWTTPGCQSRSCLRRSLIRGPAMDRSVVGEMWQLQTYVRPVSRRRNGTTLLRTGGTGASVAIGSHQASPNQECSSVSAAATFAFRMIYPDTRTTALPNSYHRLRRWDFQRSKGVRVLVCVFVHAFEYMCVCVCIVLVFAWVCKRRVNYRVCSGRELTTAANTRQILAADAAPNSGGEWISLTTTGKSAEKDPISCIHVPLVPGHKFPVDCG